MLCVSPIIIIVLVFICVYLFSISVYHLSLSLYHAFLSVQYSFFRSFTPYWVCTLCGTDHTIHGSLIIQTISSYFIQMFASAGDVTVLFFLQLLHLGTISEPNQNFSIFFFPFFSPSPNVTWSLPFPCGPIEHCYIPCFHCFMFHHSHYNTEHINNICTFT